MRTHMPFECDDVASVLVHLSQVRACTGAVRGRCVRVCTRTFQISFTHRCTYVLFHSVYVNQITSAVHVFFMYVAPAARCGKLNLEACV